MSAALTAQADAMYAAVRALGRAFLRPAQSLPSAAPLAARCPSCDRRMRVTVDRLDGRLRRHRDHDGTPCPCRAPVRDAIECEARALDERASAYRMRVATRRALLTNPLRRARPDDLRRVLRWEDRAAVVEHIALRLRAWVTGVYEHRT